MLSRQERAVLLDIELALRADDGRLASCLQSFQLDPLLVYAKPELSQCRERLLVRVLRWASCGIAFALLMGFWWFVLIGGGELRQLAAVLICPATILLVTAGLALAPASRCPRSRAG